METIGYWVQIIGFVFLATGFVFWCLSIQQVERGQGWSVVSRGWFQRRSDYTDLGWTAVRLAWLFEIVAFVLFFASVYLFGYD